MSRGAPAALPQHVPALQFHDAAGAPDQQHGHPVGRDGGGHADHRAARVALPHAGEPRGGVEVLHPLRRRHRAGAVRHDPPVSSPPRSCSVPDGGALLWTELNAVKGQLEPTVLSLAFVFLLVGYGTKVGLVPLHNWLPDAHAEGPTPVSAVLSGPAAQRRAVCRRALQGAGRRRRSNRLREEPDDGLRPPVGRGRGASCCRGRRTSSACSRTRPIEHMGIITFAFGMGGPIANFAGLLHMTVHSLTKSAIFFAVGHADAKGRHAGDGRHPRPRHA